MAENSTMKKCLADLQRVFPDVCCYIDQTVSASIGRHGQSIDSRIEIQIDTRNGDVLYHEFAPTFKEAMVDVLKWKELQHG